MLVSSMKLILWWLTLFNFRTSITKNDGHRLSRLIAPIQILLMAIALSACLPMPQEKSSVPPRDMSSGTAAPISLPPQSSSPLLQALFEAPTVARSFSAAIAAKAQVRIVTTEKSSKVDLSGSTGLTGENNHSTKGAAAATVKAYKLLYDNGQTDRSILLSELAAQSALRDAETILDYILTQFNLAFTISIARVLWFNQI